MRVLLVSDSYPPLIGGATRATRQLGQHLAGSGNRVWVATPWQRGAAARETDGAVDVHRLRGMVSRVGFVSADPTRYTPPPFPDPELVWRLRKLVRSARPDVIHTYGWLTYSLMPALIGLSIPVVLGARDYGYFCAVRTLVRQGRDAGAICDGPERDKCLDCAGHVYGQPKAAAAVAGVLGGRGLLRRAQAVQSPSRFAQSATHAHLGSSRLDAVIPDFADADPDADAASDAAILERLPDRPYILFVGAFRRIKGDAVLIEAYRRLEAPPPLVMIGARTAEALPDAPPGVTVLTDVPHNAVMAAWDRALFGVFPSVVPETLGNVVHEAMARGTAVIGTRPGGHEDMIEDGRTGLLVPAGDVQALADALRRLLDDPQACRDMGAAAIARAAAFRAESVMPAFVHLLAEVAATPTTARLKPPRG